MQLVARHGLQAFAQVSPAGLAAVVRRPSGAFISTSTSINASVLSTPRRKPQPTPTQCRWSSANSRWKQGQGSDHYARQARVQGLKSRAAFKLLEMDSRYRLFKRGQTVVDLGYAPGSWSQVALDRTKPTGKVIGIDIIPAQPPRGVTTIQGNFLSPGVQALVKDYLLEVSKRSGVDDLRRLSSRSSSSSPSSTWPDVSEPAEVTADEDPAAAATIMDKPSYIDTERSESFDSDKGDWASQEEEEQGRLVDVVLSDMSEPWPQTAGFSSRTLSNPYDRMMNTSGMSFRDHAGSMDLCLAALTFASDTLRTGGHFVCKFYQGSEDKQLENKLKKMFERVHREKPDSSRNESRESFFVALRRKGDVTLSSIE